ncbi:hypothetical protein L963_1339 [Leuconostoc mesenteroides subsp. cremoris T26]|nr:hypothetical protein L963_1339 [Leuconostoc mesenteroides subsp. cremoris T26]
MGAKIFVGCHYLAPFHQFFDILFHLYYDFNIIFKNYFLVPKK